MYLCSLSFKGIVIATIAIFMTNILFIFITHSAKVIIIPTIIIFLIIS